MTVSVIIPAYNCENTLSQTIESVLSQTFSDFELIIVNDGSTDKTFFIAQEYAKKDNRITVKTLQNGGPAKARNAGIRFSKGAYIWFIDSDDTAEPDFLDNMLSSGIILAGSQNGERPDLILCGYYMDTLSKGGEVSTSQEFLCKLQDGESLSSGGFIESSEISAVIIPLVSSHLIYVVWNKLYSRDFLLANNLFFLDSMSGEDRLFNLEVILKLSSLSYLAKPLYHYKIRQGTLSGRYVANRFETALVCHKRMEEILARFDCVDDYALGVVGFALIKQALATVTSLYSPSCKLDKKAKKESIKKIISSPSLKDAVNGPQGGITAKVSAIILKTQSVFLTAAFARTINLLQIKCSSLFLKLKHKQKS